MQLPLKECEDEYRMTDSEYQKNYWKEHPDKYKVNKEKMKEWFRTEIS